MIKSEMFNKAITKMVLKHGAKKADYWYKWIIDTNYGKLYITVHEPEKRQKLFSVFCRFLEPDKAKLHTSCNPYSGKWNFHITEMKECIQIFEYHLKFITGMTKIEKVLYEACKNALGFGSVKSLSRFVEPGVTLEKNLEESIKLIEEKYILK